MAGCQTGTVSEGAGEGLGPGFDLQLAAATIRAGSEDTGFLLRLLTNQLAAALGPRLTVERRRGLLRKSEEIDGVRIDLGSDAYEARMERGSLECTIGRSSGGIRIRSEKVTVDEWLRRLLAGLQEEATHSSATRTALENMVLGTGGDGA